VPYDPDERFELDDEPEDVLKKLLGVEDETEDQETEGDEPES
jgi:hypothetical protein